MFKFLFLAIFAFVAVTYADNDHMGFCQTQACTYMRYPQNCDFDYNPFTVTSTDNSWQNAFDINMTLYAHNVGVTGHPSFPFGAILVDSTTNQVVCTAYNGASPNLPDFANHAEAALIENCTKNGWVPDLTSPAHYTLYTNVESCPMCLGWAVYAKYINRIVFGASAEQLVLSQCLSQFLLTDAEMAVHAYDGGKNFMDIRGPLPIWNTIVKDFPKKVSVRYHGETHICTSA